MTYLKNLVIGSAAATIAGFKLSNENYTQAVTLLHERYDNKQLQVSSHMNNLLRLQPITTLREVDALRDLYNKVETQIRSLENLSIDSTKYGPLLIPVLLSKIPDELNLIISRQFTNNDCWDIVPVLNALTNNDCWDIVPVLNALTNNDCWDIVPVLNALTNNDCWDIVPVLNALTNNDCWDIVQY